VQVPFEHLHGFAEFRRIELVDIFALILLQIRQSQLGRFQTSCLEALPNQLAVNPDSAIVVAVADVSQQTRNFWNNRHCPSLDDGFTFFRLSGCFSVSDDIFCCSIQMQHTNKNQDFDKVKNTL
jgi:hypothetical protein